MASSREIGSDCWEEFGHRTLIALAPLEEEACGESGLLC